MAKKADRPAKKGNGKSSKQRGSAPAEAANYLHPTADSPLRPDVGTQAQFKKKKPPATYRYDSSLSPEMNFDGQNPAREQGEAQIRVVGDGLQKIQRAISGVKDGQLSDAQQKSLLAELTAAQDAAARLKALSKPFLNWSGKAEHVSFDVPTLPLFVHERLSTRVIIDTLTGHKRDQQMALFADPQRPISEQVLKAYEHRDKWVNRMILGDSLVVMNSLLHYEGLGGQVQMIYMDPPYGVKFGSNFQPFVRKRDVSHNDDDDMTREPEMVKAYRDTWELGLHSYLTYLRDRFLLSYELLKPTGSIFVQISDENAHVVRQVLDEAFRPENFISTIVFQKTGAEEGEGVANAADYLLWYCKDRSRFSPHPLYHEKRPGGPGAKQYVSVESPDRKTIRRMTAEEISNPSTVPPGWRICCRGFPLSSQDYSATRTVPFNFEGKEFWPSEKRNRHWSISPEKGLPSLVIKGRIYSTENSLRAIVYLDEIPGAELANIWTDTGTGSFTDEQLYVVQTSTKVIERCIQMATSPGDLVLDPTCGSGTTAYAAEKLGRRWITVDISRVPLALARQRLLCATFAYYRLQDDSMGPASGFVYLSESQSTNRKADGFGIRMQHTLSSIAGDEAPQPIVFRECPEIDYSTTRVAGPFCFEASIPTPMDLESSDSTQGASGENESGGAADGYGLFVDRMLEVLRKSPVLHLEGNRTVTLRNVRPPAKTLSLSAEAMVEGHAPGTALTPGEAVQVAMERNGKSLPFTGRPVALVFGPENGAVSEKLVYEAAREAHAKGYTHLYVIGFAIQPNARKLVDDSEAAVGVPATYVQATPDLLMGDLLKNMRSSQIFSVCGLPEVKVSKVKDGKFQVELLGLDVFDPITMENEGRAGNDVPCWLLDTDYNGLCFHVCQAFFPRTSAWDNLKRSLRATYDESVWDHLAGSVSAPFGPGEQKQIAVKVIDDRGNELLVVKAL